MAWDPWSTNEWCRGEPERLAAHPRGGYPHFSAASGIGSREPVFQFSVVRISDPAPVPGGYWCACDLSSLRSSGPWEGRSRGGHSGSGCRRHYSPVSHLRYDRAPALGVGGLVAKPRGEARGDGSHGKLLEVRVAGFGG